MVPILKGGQKIRNRSRTWIFTAKLRFFFNFEIWLKGHSVKPERPFSHISKLKKNRNLAVKIQILDRFRIFWPHFKIGTISDHMVPFWGPITYFHVFYSRYAYCFCPKTLKKLKNRPKKWTKMRSEVQNF